MSLYQNRVRIAEEVSEQEALRKKYEIEENVVVKERTFFGKFLLRYLKDIIKVLFAVFFWILAGIGVFSVCYPAIRAELLLALSDVLGFVNFGG